MENSEIEKTKSFEENLMDRIRDSIGELMPDEKLKEILERGVEEALFKGKRIQKQYGEDEFKTCLVEEMVEELLLGKMKEAVNQWLKDNPEKIEEAIKNAIENGAGQCMVQALDRRFEPAFMQLSNKLQENGIF